MKEKVKTMAKKALQKAPAPRGWDTTDEDEIRMRQLRAATEPMDIQALDKGNEYYSTFAVRAKSTLNPYRVEIRSLDRRENTCTCPDFRVNGLGTCKHIEAVFVRLRKKGAKAFAAATATGPFIAEAYLARQGAPEVRLLWPAKVTKAAQNFFSPFFGADARLVGEPSAAVPALVRAWKSAPARVRLCARVSFDVEEWNDELARRGARVRARVVEIGQRE